MFDRFNELNELSSRRQPPKVIKKFFSAMVYPIKKIRDFCKNPFEFMFNAEKNNFISTHETGYGNKGYGTGEKADISANPFKSVKLGHRGERPNFKVRVAETFRVIKGDNGYLRNGQTKESDPNEIKMGFARYLIDVPVWLVHAAIPGSFYLLALLGRDLIKSVAFICQKLGKLGSVLTSPFWLPFALLGLGVMGAGLIGYAVTKPLLSAVKALVKNVIVPLVSGIVTAALMPVDAIVHLFFKITDARDNYRPKEKKIKGSHANLNQGLGNSQQQQEYKGESYDGNAEKPSSTSTMYVDLKDSRYQPQSQYQENSMFQQPTTPQQGNNTYQPPSCGK